MMALISGIITSFMFAINYDSESPHTVHHLLCDKNCLTLKVITYLATKVKHFTRKDGLHAGKNQRVQ